VNNKDFGAETDMEAISRVARGMAPPRSLDKRLLRLADYMAEDLLLLPLTPEQRLHLERYKQLRRQMEGV